MPVVQAPPLTKEDYRKLPNAGPRFQLIEGELYLAPAPNRYHQIISRSTSPHFPGLRISGAAIFKR